MIEWKDIKDLHLEGKSSLGKVIIRIDRDNQVTGMYTFFRSTEKYMPDDKHEEEIAGAQLRLEEIVRLHELAEELS